MIVGAHFATRTPTGFLRTALGVVLIASGLVTVQKGDPVVWPIAAIVAGIGLALLIWAPRVWQRRRAEREARELAAAADRRGPPPDRPSGRRLHAPGSAPPA